MIPAGNRLRRFYHENYASSFYRGEGYVLIAQDAQGQYWCLPSDEGTVKNLETAGIVFLAENDAIATYSNNS